MKPTLPLFTLVAALLGGCSIPPTAGLLQVTTVDSPIVRVTRADVERAADGWRVTGLVLRRRDAGSTTATHIDVSCIAADGRVLRTTQVRFEPAEIEFRPRHAPVAHFQCALEPLPPETARIEIRAHEGTENP